MGDKTGSSRTASSGVTSDAGRTPGGASRRWTAQLSLLAFLVWGCSPADRGVDPRVKLTFPVDTHCYLNAFEPARFPWTEAECLNFEEVFKNHTYFEARSDPDAEPARVVVAKFVRGAKVEELA